MVRRDALLDCGELSVTLACSLCLHRELIEEERENAGLPGGFFGRGSAHTVAGIGVEAPLHYFSQPTSARR